ncbi:hypothetical protein MTX78_21315 [Hymenobacter tibetensis]|uniref:RagB/SusD family nutrient uptake outer membrane protein n=1 Tax=Hymenobacter tibetensis TaxID=497967 RepID=A0ABY4CWJ4_9BACT|nr:hypothetical protein [Hymenobacter tibetensis]UOG74644.1 hypothetical protein MTX78_21315 [Hymenobacter tibetensis]
MTLLAFATSCDDSDPTPENLNLVLGNPSGATSNAGQPNNYLLTRPEYALSYHHSRGIPFR